MSSLDILKSKYKPYRYTLNKGVTIVESSSGKFVIKKQNKDLFGLFNYLESRGFNSFPKITYNFRNQENVFEYINEEYIPDEQKLVDLASEVSSLHNKTVYFKQTALDDYKEIYDNIDSNIAFLSAHFESMFLNVIKEEFLSPSKYLFVRNYYKIKQSLNFCKSQLDIWYEMVKENTSARVSVVHNNLALDHFRFSQTKSAIVSWDNYKIDTPIIDIVNLYQKEYLNYDFSEFLKKYLYNFDLTSDEQKLLFILLSLPLYFEIEESSEFNNTKHVKEKIKYIFITEKLIRPYYPEDTEE